jgi:hypothetical protein
MLIYLGFLVLLGWRFFDDNNRGAAPGDEVWLFFSHHCAETDAELAEMLIKDDRPVMKIPTFKMRIDTELTQVRKMPSWPRSWVNFRKPHTSLTFG